MSSDLLKIQWQNRYDSLAPCAVVAFDETAVSMAERLLSLDDEALSSIQGVGGRRMIFLAANAENLPWVDGASYLGRDVQLSGILLPTTLKPNVPPGLFERILKEKYREHIPFAVLPEKIIPYGAAKALSRNLLRKWLSENR